ncbi:HNH endonuclease family protein [Nonomuraea typhae]|uniref:HNH endonuclease family protein n=1 Tax=Nonomuraea typhae TaxID=2603600 RepID=UPI0012FCF886|nr:HNH endonuclease family protein [Nonomuraea typhae]
MPRSAALLAVILTTLTLTVTPASAAPAGIPSRSAAVARLAELTVAPESHNSSYNRALFPHWSRYDAACDTREMVLERDGQDVVRDESCAAVSGTWRSPYDGAIRHRASDLDVDHLVSLHEAWGSGAWAWTTAKRRAFANDLVRPELWAVTQDINEAKGGLGPARWRPPARSFHCTYARAWIQVKWFWKLSIDAREKVSLREMLALCA